MSDACGPTRSGVAATAFASMLACVPAHELSSYSRGDGVGGDAATSLGGAAGGAGLGSGGLPGEASSGGTDGTPSPDSGTPSDGGAGGAGASPPSPVPDAGGAPAAPDAAPDAAVVEPPPPCPGGVLEANTQTCYFVASTARSWLDARQLCENAGRALVKIDSAAEDGFVADLSPASLWIGASDTAVDGAFVWSDGSPIVFSNWGGSQPDAFPGPDCVEKRQESGEPWYDQPCSNARLYVCEQHPD
jgi:hypothetical protein